MDKNELTELTNGFLKKRLREVSGVNLKYAKMLKDLEKRNYQQRLANRKLHEAHRSSLKKIQELESIIGFKSSVRGISEE